jgi:hypothetical protein
MAHLILELHERLSQVGLVHNRSFAMPVTQEMIGDALGLSAYSTEVGRRFRAKSATCSNRSRPGIPVKSAGVASSAG